MNELTYRTREPEGEPEGALVLFHGRGSDEHDLFPLLDVLDPARRLLGLTPRGPLALPPGGAHWYAFREVGYPDPATFLPTFELVSRWLDSLPVPPERTILGGFSQGAVMTYAMGLGRGRPRPAAMIALSGFAPAVEGFELDLESPIPPVAIAHGTLDPVIGVEWSRRAREMLQVAGAEPLYLESPLDHTIDPRILPDLRSFVSSAIRRLPAPAES